MKWWKANVWVALISGLAVSVVLWTLLAFVPRVLQMGRATMVLWTLQEIGIIASYLLFTIHAVTTIEMTGVAIPVNGLIYAAIIYVGLRMWRGRVA